MTPEIRIPKATVGLLTLGSKKPFEIPIYALGIVTVIIPALVVTAHPGVAVNSTAKLLAATAVHATLESSLTAFGLVAIVIVKSPATAKKS